ncbi:MAG: DNA polymerase/3'-5' exonuclease PolX [Candidatus Omnitrophota bacterium]
MKNSEVSNILRETAKLLEIKGDNPFRIRAYERAAQNIEGLNEDIENLIREARLTGIPGIGNDLADKIKEIVTTGSLKTYAELKKDLPEGILELLDIPSVGPKTARMLYEKLNIGNIQELEGAIEKHKLQGVYGIKEKTVENILKGIGIIKRGRERMTLAEALQTADKFIRVLEKNSGVKKISSAGSLRRFKETVRDIDILISSDNPKEIMDIFIKLSPGAEILAKGATKSSIRTKNDVQIDCRVVTKESFGAALLYFTGSKNFNIKLRQLAIKKGLKINEYGIFKNEKIIAGRTEEEIFKALGIDYIEPELREDTGEIELAQTFNLPKLVELNQIKADLHMHSRWSDGKNSIEEIAAACQKRGYAYAGITDHSQSLKVAKGLTTADLRKKRDEIEKINRKLSGFRVLYGAEVDIDSQGNLDYNDGILKELDFVIAAIHTGFKQSRQQLTRRVIKACENKYVHVIAHPTGRLWGIRDAYDIDLEEILKAAKQTNTALEINSYPQRLDLNDLNCRKAKEMGVKISLGSDAHNTGQLEAIKFGVSMARRGWIANDDVLNTLTCDELLKTIKK